MLTRTWKNATAESSDGSEVVIGHINLKEI